MESLLTLMGKDIKIIKKLNWLFFVLIIPFDYSYIFLRKFHRKLATVLNWLIFTLKVLLEENKGR